MKLKYIAPVLLATVIFASCKRDGLNPDNSSGSNINNNVERSQDMVVPNGFDYATTQDLTLDVRLTDRNGNPLQGVRIDVFDAPNDGVAERKVYATGITDDFGVLNVPLSLPTYQKQVTIFPYAMGVPQNVEVPVSGSKVSFHYTNGKMQTMVAPPSTQTSTALQAITNSFSRKTGVADKFSFKLGGWDVNGVPNYLTTPDVLTTAFKNRILGALPENKAVPVFRPQYINNVLPVIEVTQTADVWITFVHEGASLKNVLFYYIYNKNSPPATANDIDSLYTIFPNSSFSGSGGGLAAGDKVKIGRFGKDTIIGFAMAANGFNGSSQVTKGLNVWYSHKSFNAEASAFQDHAIMLYDAPTERYIIAFEDVRRDNGQSDQDFNDAVFFASANPPKNITSNVPPTPDSTDCDNDGVPDFYDDYPCDSTKAYDRYFPSESEFGTLAYEDLWPSTGDYDMNDLVIRWRFHACVDPQNRVIELNAIVYPEAKGAALPGGFGVEFPFNASLVNQVTGSQITGNRATLAANGLEAGQTKAVMIFFDKVVDQLSKPGGSFFNTRRFAPVAIPDTIKTKMTFHSPLNFSSLGTYPFNPFLFTSSRSVEVHLPNKSNTALANTGLFGTGNDNSIPSSNRYYKTVGNLPWAIHFPIKFDYPAEKKDIVTAHLKFAAWVQSNGFFNADWYEDKPGHRNDVNLYVPAP
jgi:LruC domain-containing protein